jgi:hypothetical protein
MRRGSTAATAISYNAANLCRTGIRIGDRYARQARSHNASQASGCHGSPGAN